MSATQDELGFNQSVSGVGGLRNTILGVAVFAIGFFVGDRSVEASETSGFDLIYEVTMARMELAEMILRTSADYWSENPDASGLNAHLSLRQILNDSSYFRSILAVDEEGALAFDSFNPIPFLGAKDLSDRGYWKRASGNKPKEMIFGRTVTGRQSGLAFVPLAMAVPGGGTRNQRVVALTALPEKLLPTAGMCNFCGVSLLSGGEVVASNRPLSAVNSAVLEELNFEGLYGAETFDLRGMEVVAHWRKSDQFDLIMVYYEAEPSGE